MRRRRPDLGCCPTCSAWASSLWVRGTALDCSDGWHKAYLKAYKAEVDRLRLTAEARQGAAQRNIKAEPSKSHKWGLYDTAWKTCREWFTTRTAVLATARGRGQATVVIAKLEKGGGL